MRQQSPGEKLASQPYFLLLCCGWGADPCLQGADPNMRLPGLPEVSLVPEAAPPLPVVLSVFKKLFLETLFYKQF